MKFQFDTVSLDNSNYKLYVKNGLRDNYLSEPEFPLRLRLRLRLLSSLISLTESA